MENDSCKYYKKNMKIIYMSLKSTKEMKISHSQ